MGTKTSMKISKFNLWPSLYCAIYQKTYFVQPLDAFKSHKMLFVTKTKFWQTATVKKCGCATSSLEQKASVSSRIQAVLASWMLEFPPVRLAFSWETPGPSSAVRSLYGGQGQDAAIVGEILGVAP